VRADPTRLDLVLSNLLTNAVKYTDRGGKVTVRVERDGAEAVVWVHDTGVGIPAEVLPRLFDLLIQEDRAADHSQGGLGIGLHLVKLLTELHGGSVAADSEGPGKRSEFVVRLPEAGPGGAEGASAEAQSGIAHRPAGESEPATVPRSRAEGVGG
jgi:signal transduction histidine kinase